MKALLEASLPDLPDALADDRGKVAAAEALGVNQHAMLALS